MMPTSSRYSHGQEPNNKKKYDAMNAKVLSLYERCDRDTRLRAPLDSTAIYPKPSLPTNNTRPAKEKPYQEHTFALSIPLEFDVDHLGSSRVGTPFLIALA